MRRYPTLARRIVGPSRAALLVASIVCACACAAPPSRAPARASAPLAAAPALVLAPARYLVTDHLGVMFDEAGQGSDLPRAEPAILDGVRVLVDGGLVVASARHADRLSGFRSLPARLGGGFVLWSEDRVYRAGSFLADLEPLVDVGATGGARPWLGSVLLRTPSGLLEIDPVTHAVHGAAMPGIADALALDARRAARVDALGRASITVDGGATWTDVSTTRGVVVSALREGAAGDVVLATVVGPHWSLGPRGALRPIESPEGHVSALGEPRPATPSLASLFPATSRALPGELVSHAVAYGALLDGGRLLVTRENGVRVLAAETGLPVADADLAGVDERFAHCQAVVMGAPPRPALACAGDAGAELLDLDGSLLRPALAATFPGAGGGFIGGPRGRLAFDGPCGPEAPRGGDLGPGTAKPGSEPTDESPQGSAAPPPPVPPAPPTPVELPPDDDARVCLRSGPSRWIERRLRGDDARRLYRWVPGDDGTVTALILGNADEPAPDAGSVEVRKKPRPGEPSARKKTSPPAGPSPPPEGVRVIHLDPEDPALLGGAFPAVSAPQKELPYRTVDADFWQDDDGAVRGWIRLPPVTDEEPLIEPAPQGAARRSLRVSSVRGGQSAGVRIDPAGQVTVLALPEGVTEVVTGGRFGLATATHDGVAAWFETLDGGARWTPVEGPPMGSLAAPGDEHAPFACSPAGCAWGSGVVRLGWGSPPPHVAAALTLGPAQSPRPRDPGPLTLSCRLDDAAPPWSVTASKSASGRGAKPPSSMALRFAVDGTLVTLDAARGLLSLSRGAATTPVMRMTRVPEVSRLHLTLAQRLGARGLAVVTYSTSSGEVLAGDVDLGRAQAGPLAALGRLETIADAGTVACAAVKATHRFLADLPVKLRISGRGGEALLDQQVTAAVLIEASAERLCVTGVEAALPKGKATVLSAVLGRAASASLRSEGRAVRAACVLGSAR